MISRLLLSMKPAAAAAHPEYELSIETTTGMSPPPIAATRCRPSSSAMTVMIASGQMLGAPGTSPAARHSTISAPRFIQFRPGSVNGADLIFADSFRYGDDRAGEGDRADEYPQENLDEMDRVAGLLGEVGVETDQHRRQHPRSCAGSRSSRASASFRPGGPPGSR